MINNKDYKNLQKLKKNDLNSYNTVMNILDSNSKELSIASHEIKNMIAFISNSYQLLSSSYPETGTFDFWSEIGGSINDLVRFMDRTTLYRYSGKQNKEQIDVGSLLFSLPDKCDNLHPDSIRVFSFDIDINPIYIYADRELLTTALSEILSNCYDSTINNDNINITCHVTEQEDIKKAHLTIASKGQLTDEPDKLLMPFFTTKNNHFGLGLSIAFNVIQSLNGDISLSQDNEFVKAIIDIPLMNTH